MVGRCAGAFERGRKWWAGWQVGEKLSTRMVPSRTRLEVGFRARPLIDCTKSRYGMGTLAKKVAGVWWTVCCGASAGTSVFLSMLPFGCSQIHQATEFLVCTVLSWCM